MLRTFNIEKEHEWIFTLVSKTILYHSQRGVISRVRLEAWRAPMTWVIERTSLPQLLQHLLWVIVMNNLLLPQRLPLKVLTMIWTDASCRKRTCLIKCCHNLVHFQRTQWYLAWQWPQWHLFGHEDTSLEWLLRHLKVDKKIFHSLYKCLKIIKCHAY